jgi:hypothetical protein
VIQQDSAPAPFGVEEEESKPLLSFMILYKEADPLTGIYKLRSYTFGAGNVASAKGAARAAWNGNMATKADRLGLKISEPKLFPAKEIPCDFE